MISIEANIAARLAAEQVAELADGEAENHGRRFWSELLRIIRDRLPPPLVQKKASVQMMSDQEAGLFGRTERVPFGEFVGKRVDDVPLERLQWYADQTFVDDLRRYLQSDRVKGERDAD